MVGGAAASARAQERGLRRPRAVVVLAALAVAGLVVVLVGSALGSAAISPMQELRIVGHALGLPVTRTWTDADAEILLQLRLPRVLGAFLVGAALSTAGATMQGVFRNPLADPYVLGSSAGAGLGAVIALAISARWTALGFGPVPALAFAGALGATLLVYSLARVGWRAPVTNMLLAGAAVGSLLGAAMSFVVLFGGLLAYQARSVFVWLLGGVSVAGWDELRVLVPLLVVAIAATWTLARQLDALALGEDGASYLGINVERTKLVAIGLGALLTAVAVSISGLIGFVGLVVPHTLRLAIGPRHGLLLPASALLGGAFVVLLDLIGRIALAPNEIPVGLLSALVGAPFFLYLLRRRGSGYSL